MCERPLECGQCKKQTTIKFTEIKGKMVSHLEACSDCPIIQARLHMGKNSANPSNKPDLICPMCKTTEEAIKTGGLIGCEQCYSTFADLIFSELTKMGKVENSFKFFSKASLTPEEGPKAGKNEKLKELSIALNSAVENEDYEQAAWLRDRIKSVMEESNE